MLPGGNASETEMRELADTDEKLAQSKEDLDDAKASLTEDEAFTHDVEGEMRQH